MDTEDRDATQDRDLQAAPNGEDPETTPADGPASDEGPGENRGATSQDEPGQA